MAIYHLAAKVISRANGSSALAAAAYRSASRLHDQRLDRHHDFSNKAGVVHSEVLLPEQAPEQFRDREGLWNAVEASERRNDAQLAREIEVAIPRELDQADGIDLAREFVKAEFVERGMIADLNVHWDIGEDGSPKPHAHIMLSMRAVDGDGFGAKVRDWNRTDLLEHWRETWADQVNQRLAERDIDATVDHRSLEAQGIDLEPQHKIGPAAARMAAQGLSSERLAEHRAIARANGEKLFADPALALDVITRTQATFTHRDLAMLVHRHSDGKEQFDSVMAAVKASPELVALGSDGRGQARFTSRDMRRTERRLERATDRLAGRAGHGLAERALDGAIARSASRGLILGGLQKAALDHVARPRDLGTVIGYAGTGKSAMLGVARDAWEESGYQVIGAALSGIAAENLEQGSGIASRTLASLDHHWGQGRELLSDRSILVIDEAGMIGTRQMERVLAEAEKRRAKVVLVGDPEQLQAIEAGAAFRAIAERHGAVEITEVRRQRADWQRDATRKPATGRTGETIQAYAHAGMVADSPTRESARLGLIERWDADRTADPAASRIILTHTRKESAELNALARDRLRQNGMLATDIAIKTSRGEALFAAGDRVMFLKNDRGMDVRNGTLGTIDQLSKHRVAVRLDDGRRVAFDLKDYADLTHGYATTIHKAQGVTVDRTHVLATPGLDRHATYVALSRHRDTVRLHYGRDDFADLGKLVRTLARERPKDMALDYQAARDRFAERRGFDRSAILDALAGERLVDPTHRAPAPERRDMFAGLDLGAGRDQPKVARGMFDGLDLSGIGEPATDRHPDRGVGAAVRRYVRALLDMQRMSGQGLPVLEQQKVALGDAAHALDAVWAHGSEDLDAAIAREPGLAGEAAADRTAALLRAMEIEREVRGDPELRADRFVQTWNQYRRQRDTLGGGENDEARERVEGRMRAMVKRLDRDPALAAALGKRGSQLFGRRWSPEWSPGSRDGGIGRDLGDRARTRAIIQQLTDTLGRGRDIGIGL